MTINLTGPANHPANGPLTAERIECVIEALQRSILYQNGGDMAYVIADAIKGLEELLVSKEAASKPVGNDELDHLIWGFQREGFHARTLAALVELREVRKAKGEPVITCWSCRKEIEVIGVRDCDGCCPECSSPIDLDDEPYTAPPAPVTPDGWREEAERLAELHGCSFVVFRHGEEPQCADPTKVIISFTDKGLGYSDSDNFRGNVNSSTKHFRENSEASTNSPDSCWCRSCRPVTISDMRFVVCPDCGNKRCPRANDHNNPCTGSNEPGQVGSAYPAAPKEVG